MTTARLLERSATHERLLVLLGLSLVAAIGLFVTLQIGDILMMPTAFAGHSLVYPVLLFIMWWTMMMAMMMPSAAPAILTYGAISRKFAEKGRPAAPLVMFVAGYAVIWTGFAALATSLQVLTRETIALSMMMAVTSAVVGGGLLLAAGFYQMSPLKAACLQKCQAPLMFFARDWQAGSIGALRMGLAHGVYCLGCCWVLMGLLFYGGVMEPLWILGLAVYVAIEKLIPVNNRLSRFTGSLLVAWGAWVICRAVV
jgi:predicted metal-binding membrane protein